MQLSQIGLRPIGLDWLGPEAQDQSTRELAKLKGLAEGQSELAKLIAWGLRPQAKAIEK